jgi:imidazolonepropionase
MSVLLITRASQLLTMAGPRGPRRGSAMRQLGLIEDGALLAHDGLVVATGRSADVERLPEAQGATVIDAMGKVIVPAFVDSHTHLVFAQPRLSDFEMRIGGAKYEMIAKAGGGIASSVRTTRAATREDLTARAIYYAQQGLAHGTATLEVKSGYGLDAETEIRILEVIRSAGLLCSAELIPTFLGAHVVPQDMPRAAYLKLLTGELIPHVAREGLAEFCDVFCDRGAYTLAEARAIFRTATRHKLKLKIHAEQLTRTGSAVMAARMGAVSADHLDCVTRSDIALLAKSKTIATLLPGCSMFLGLPYPPARRLLDGGVAVALATDFNPGTSPTLNMSLMMSLACTQMRMSPAEALTAATINAAHAVGRGDRLGSLDEGKQADLAIFDADDFREIPYYLGMHTCWMTIRKGQVVWSREMVSQGERCENRHSHSSQT